jgi:hypothetical protein
MRAIQFLDEDIIENARDMTLERNRMLFTKDGRKTGNALIVTRIEPEPSFPDYRYKIITDYGDEAILTMREICTLFYSTTPRADKTHKHYVKVVYKKKEKK